MSSRIRAHIRGNIVGYIAVFIALSGTAYAADTIGSSDVIDESLLSQDLKNGEVRSSDIDNGGISTDDISNTNGVRSGDVRDDTLPDGGLAAVDLSADSVGTSEVDGSLTGADVAPESLTGDDITGLTGGDIENSSLTGTDLADNLVTGADINESTLSTVPNAGEVDGLGARSFEFSAGTAAATTTVLNQGGLSLKADCDAFNGNSRVELFVDSSINDSTLYAVDEPPLDAGDPTFDGDFDSAEANHQLIVEDASGALEVGRGTVQFRGGPEGGTDTSSDDVVTVQYVYVADANCSVFGTAIGGPS
ncbi:MAG: hypothetical protein ACJ75I_12140 [Solirubrobacterales bacterium]